MGFKQITPAETGVASVGGGYQPKPRVKIMKILD